MCILGVWCPVCNQGFTRHYNLKVHMYKSHGKEYLENNFSQEELDAIMRPPPGSNTSKPSPTPRKRSEEEIVIPGTPTGVLPISPPLTPKLSPKQKLRHDDSPTMVPSNSVIPSANFLKHRSNNNVAASRPGPASLTKPKHYFDQEAQHSMLQCQLCDDKFLRKTDLFIHIQKHGVTVISCQLCEDKFLDVEHLKRHLTSAHGHLSAGLAGNIAGPSSGSLGPDSGDSDGEGASGDTSPVSCHVRRPGPASRTNAPRENRPTTTTNLPSHLAGQCQENVNGFPCDQCGKVLMHKQSYVSHMRVIHGDYYGGNKWKGSSVVEMVLGGSQKQGVVRKSSSANSPVNYAHNDQNRLDEHIQSKHPNLTNRIQAFKAALGLNDSEEPDTKRIKLDYKGILKDQNENSLSSYSVLSFSAAAAPSTPAQFSGSSGGWSSSHDEPLDLACKPVSLNVDCEDHEVEPFVHDANNNQNHSNNLLQIARPLPASSPPCSPLNLHISRPNTPDPNHHQPSQPLSPPAPASQPPTEPPPTVSSQPSQEQVSLQLPPPPPPTNPSTQNMIQGSGSAEQGQSSSAPPTQPKLHEYLVKQSNATSDENGRKKFLCPVCKCQLSWKTNLSVHLRTHSGERPFQCVLCLNRFRQKAHLYKHFRCSHGHKVAPYKCMFCTESFTRSPNDLYNHITEVHKRETDELTNNNNNISNNNNNIKSVDEDNMEEKSKEEEENQIEDLSQPKSVVEEQKVNHVQQHLHLQDVVEENEEDIEDDFEPKDRDDETRFEAIQEEFQFDGKLIKPSYCVLPFVTDDEVEACTRRNIAVSPTIKIFLPSRNKSHCTHYLYAQEYYEQPEDYSEDEEEGQMVIDESPSPPAPAQTVAENLILAHRDRQQISPPVPSPMKNNFNNNELKINSFGQGFANAINIW